MSDALVVLVTTPTAERAAEIARAWRDVRVMTIAGGTSEIMKELVARQSGL